jgi:peptide deformylase
MVFVQIVIFFLLNVFKSRSQLCTKDVELINNTKEPNSRPINEQFTINEEIEKEENDKRIKSIESCLSEQELLSVSRQKNLVLKKSRH